MKKKKPGNKATTLNPEPGNRSAGTDKSAEELFSIQQRYQTLTEYAPVGIFHTDATGYTTYVNPEWCRISGMSSEDALGNGWLNAVHEEDRESLGISWQEAAKMEGLSKAEYRFVRPDGSIAWVLGQAIPERNHENRIIGYVGTTTDITERIKAQHEIMKEKNLSDSVINSLPGIFYLYNREGKFLRWNTNFEKVTMYEADEIRHMHPLDFFEGGEKELVDSKISDAFNSGEEYVQADLLLKTKKKIPYYFTGKKVEYEGSACLLGVGIDFSERVKAQEEIKQTSEKLRRLTVHLQKIREEERKRIGREIHDELGQQLTAIKMDIAWIDKKIPEESVIIKNKLRNVIGLLDGSNQSIRRILSELRPSALDNQGLVEALEWLGKQLSANTGILVQFTSTETEIKLSEPIATCIFRVYQETLTNIVRYAGAKNVWAIFSISDDVIKLSISDDGRGFDPDAVQSNKSFGILGMKERVHSLGGKFELVAEPGKGTKIMVSLPV